MKKNELYTVDCESLSDLGYGVAHVDGMAVFVSGLLPEEKARVRIIKAFKNYAIARIEELLIESPDRVKPKCVYAGKCGGCSFQHLSYPAQLKWKQKELSHLFREVDPNLNVLPVLGMEDPYYYRNKAQFPIRVKDGRLQAGFYRPKSNDIIDMEECLIQSRPINEVFAWLKQNLSLKSAQELRHLFIRASKATGEMQVVFIGRENQDLERIAKRLVKNFPQITSVVFNRNTRDDNVILGEESEVLYGSSTILEECLGLKIRLDFRSFFQVNPSQMEVLYQKALDFADLKPEDRVVELYAGTGTIGMLASRKAGFVAGVEIVPEAVENARENLELNQIKNAEYICMDASAYAAKAKGEADVVIVDPPRKGMDSQGIQDILTLSPRKVVYISCNPRTLARDMKVFMEHGYRAKAIQPVDMFAQTAGVECVTCLERQDTGNKQK